MSSTYNDSFTDSLPICIHFISFSCLIVVEKTSNTILNRNDKCENPYFLVPEFSRKTLAFTFEYYVGCGFVKNHFIMLRKVTSVPWQEVLWQEYFLFVCFVF